MGENNNVRTLFRNIRIQQPVRTLEPFALAQRTADSVDPLRDLMEGARFGGLLGAIAGQREARNMAKVEREEFEARRDRKQQIRDIANQSVTENAETGRLELDPDNFKAGLLAGGFGHEAMQIQKAEDVQEFQRLVTLEKVRADVLGAQAQMLRARQPRAMTNIELEKLALGTGPEAEEAQTILKNRSERRAKERAMALQETMSLMQQQFEAREQIKRETQEAKEQRGLMREVGSAQAVLDEIKDVSGRVNVFGPIGRLIGYFPRLIAAVTETSPDLAEMESLGGFLSGVARTLGERGVLTNQDIERVAKLLPDRNTTKEVARRNLGRMQRILDKAYARAQQFDAGTASTETRPGQERGVIGAAEQPQTKPSKLEIYSITPEGQ